VSNNAADIPASIDTAGSAAVVCRIGRAGAGGLMVSLVAGAAPAPTPVLAAGENYDTALGFALALGFFLAFLFYIIPALIAWDRRHPDVRSIWALTLLLGWTGIAWLVALIWALRTTGADRGNRHARPADPS
jgi:Superinfection immunity protein